MTFHNHLQGSDTEFAQRYRPQLLGPAKPSPPVAGDSVNCRSSEVFVPEDIVENWGRHHLRPAKVSSDTSVFCFRIRYSLR